jgi:hypothetical protein
VRTRTAALTEIVRQAVPADEQIATLWERFQREFYELGMRGLTETLARDGVLATELCPQRLDAPRSARPFRVRTDGASIEPVGAGNSNRRRWRPTYPPTRRSRRR